MGKSRKDHIHTSTGMWIIECAEAKEVVNTKEGVFPYLLAQIKRLKEGRLVVEEDVGERSWLERFLFSVKNPRIIQTHFAMEWCNDFASLIFIDDAGSEYRAKSNKSHIQPNEETRMRIAHGELTPHPVDECLNLQMALEAIEEYFKSGERPNWLEYKYVK